jgi:hypothetical protein
VDYFTYVARPGCLGTSRGSSRVSSSTTSTTPRVWVPRHVARLITRLVAPLVVDYSDYVAASARRVARHLARRRLLRLAQARRRLLRLAQARPRLLRLRHAFGCLGISRGSSLSSSRRSSSTTLPTPTVRVPRHVAWLVTRLVVDYFASHRLVDDYFAYATRPGASARRAARHAARHRLLRLRRTSGCFGTSCGLSCDLSSTTSPRAGSSSTTSHTPCVRGASARRAAHHAARRRLIRLRRASGCLGTSRGSSRDLSRRSSLTTSPTSCVRVPKNIAWLISPLVVNYFAPAACPGALALSVF